MIIGCLFLLGLVFAWAGAKAFDIGAPAECRTAPIAFGKHAAITISVKSGMSCPVIVKTATASIDELEITSFPQDGTVLARGRTGLIYRSRQSFKGEDSFAFSVRGKSGFDNAATAVRVGVLVE